MLMTYFTQVIFYLMYGKTCFQKAIVTSLATSIVRTNLNEYSTFRKLREDLTYLISMYNENVNSFSHYGRIQHALQ